MKKLKDKLTKKNKKTKAYFLRNSDHWATPKVLYDKFMSLGYIDPCPLHCEVDNLGKVYNNKRLFINPPFSQLSKWVDYIIDLYNNDNEILLLMPARTDTKYFHKLLQRTNLIIYFFKGRLKFNDSNSAPFPTLLIYISKRNVLPLFVPLEFNGDGLIL